MAEKQVDHLYTSYEAFLECEFYKSSTFLPWRKLTKYEKGAQKCWQPNMTNVYTTNHILPGDFCFKKLFKVISSHLFFYGRYQIIW